MATYILDTIMNTLDITISGSYTLTVTKDNTNITFSISSGIFTTTGSAATGDSTSTITILLSDISDYLIIQNANPTDTNTIILNGTVSEILNTNFFSINVSECYVEFNNFYFTSSVTANIETKKNIKITNSNFTSTGNFYMSNNLITPLSQNFTGIEIISSSIISSGEIIINGKSGNTNQIVFGIKIIDSTIESDSFINISGTNYSSDTSTDIKAGVYISNQNTYDISTTVNGTLSITGISSSTSLTKNNFGLYISSNNSSQNIISTSNGTITLTGTNNSESSGFCGGIAVKSAGIRANGSGNLVMTGTCQVVGTVGTDFNYGIFILDSSSISTQNGTVNINGTGGGSSSVDNNNNIGIKCQSGTLTPGGNLTLTGNGGLTHGNSNVGIFISLDFIINCSNGNCTLTGVGGGILNSSNSNNRGIILESNYSTSSIHSISCSGNNNIILNGTSGSSTNGTENTGIRILNASVTSVNGNIQLNGTGKNSSGIELQLDSNISSTGTGSITFSGVSTQLDQTATSGYKNGITLGENSIASINSGTMNLNGKTDSNDIIWFGIFLSDSQLIGGTGTININQLYQTDGSFFSTKINDIVFTSGNLNIYGKLGFRLQGETVNTEYYPLTVINGNITLINTYLKIFFILDYVPPLTTQFTVIDNNGPNPINGTFSNVTSSYLYASDNSTDFLIDYLAGDGNDVVITRQANPLSGDIIKNIPGLTLKVNIGNNQFNFESILVNVNRSDRDFQKNILQHLETLISRIVNENYSLPEVTSTGQSLISNFEYYFYDSIAKIIPDKQILVNYLTYNTTNSTEITKIQSLVNLMFSYLSSVFFNIFTQKTSKIIKNKSFTFEGERITFSFTS